MFGAESWELSDAVMRDVESTDVGLLLHIIRKKSRIQSNGSWDTLAAEEVLWAVDMQLAVTYIDLQQVKLSKWVALCSLLEVCAWETGYEGGGRNRRT